ncbi:glycerol-3-phosphate acyltransferase 1, mitochondrial isoform X2 [Teleopsis dalmanni]|uniref:glycerol-3-phosphate acyltransferase 1, mitochondrial isoform X2 n=1 Tax=Teleopsis dalmanni TaxID=139649 RepID=UPI0018CF2D33|nr:glycerol-3-phosphate acyltransferase 1, mitochondrial isoform X2 [Teleopsis dalmanni]
MITEFYKIHSWFKETRSAQTLQQSSGTQNMLNLTPHAGRKPFVSSFNYNVFFSHLSQVLNIKKFNYPQISNIVQKDSVLQIAIKQAVEQILREQRSSNGTRILDRLKNDHNQDSNARSEQEELNYQKILKSQEKRTINTLKNMRSSINTFLIQLTSWVLYKLLPCFLTGVVTNTKQIKMLKKISDDAPGVPLIFVPLHRSHLDYIMVTFILANNDIRCPIVAAGDNLQIPVFGGLLRGLGAFFIKRKIDPVVGNKDILYRAILQLYIQHALKNGHNIEFFIEGGRTRTGKPCMPKGGILSVVVNAFMDHSISDALLVPVSVNYERLVDGNFVREQKGQKKEAESFSKAISAIWKALTSNYGLMRIDFNEPYSIRQLVQSYNKITKDETLPNSYISAQRVLQHNQSTSSLYGTDVVCEEHRNLIDSISRQIVYDCAQATSVMSTNALSFILLTEHRQGATGKEIAKSFDTLRESLFGQKDLGFAGESLQIVFYAADLLGDLITTYTKDGETIFKPQSNIESMIELSYYSNMLTPHFALQSILLTTFHSLLPTKEESLSESDESPLIGITRTKLVEVAEQNCDVYRYEFILCKPTENLKDALYNALDVLIERQYFNMNEKLFICEADYVKYTKTSYFEDGSEDDYNDVEQPDIFFDRESIKMQKAICEVLAPFANSYLAVAQSLYILYNNPTLETEFIKIIINKLIANVKEGQCIYAESVSIDSVRNCLKLLEKWSVVQIYNANGMRLIALNRLYELNIESLNPIIQRISAVVPIYDNGYF